MTRFLWWAMVFVFLSSLEISLVTSLPFPLSSIPLVITVSILALQVRTDGYMIGWIVLYGMMLDILHLGVVPFSVVGYTGAAIAALMVSRSLFSNRSFYGVFGTAVFALLTLAVYEFSVIVLLQLTTDTSIGLFPYLGYAIWRIVGAAVLLLLLFPLAGRLFPKIR